VIAVVNAELVKRKPNMTRVVPCAIEAKFSLILMMSAETREEGNLDGIWVRILPNKEKGVHIP
jgi:hypothetical protein